MTKVKQDPFHVFPEEISVIIISQAIWNPAEAGDTSESRRDDELLVAFRQVSWSWNSVIISAPCLWQNISSDYSIKTTKLFVEHAKSRPLDIEINEDETNPQKHARLFQALSHTAERWRSLNIYCMRQPYPQFTSHPQARNLEDIMVHACDESEGFNCDQVGLQDELLQLQKLHLEGCTLTHWNFRVWPKLKTLILSEIGINIPTESQLLNLLSHSPLLEKLSLRDWQIPTQSADRLALVPLKAPVSLPNLKELHMQNMPDRHLRAMMQNLAAPDLRTIHLDWALSLSSAENAVEPSTLRAIQGLLISNMGIDITIHKCPLSESEASLPLKIFVRGRSTRLGQNFLVILLENEGQLLDSLTLWFPCKRNFRSSLYRLGSRISNRRTYC